MPNKNSMSRIIRLKETESTNQYLQELSNKEILEEGSVVTCKSQTAGKGQVGNKWEAEQGKNITCSMILHPFFIDITEQFILSEIISLAIIDTLSTYSKDMCIKWPNDIYFQNKKIAGILIENTISGKSLEKSIIGMGININQEVFKSNAPNPVSLKQITGKDYDLEIILSELIKNIFNRYSQLIKGEKKKIHKEYLENLFRKSGLHSYKANNQIFKAEIKSIEKTGHLVLRTETKEEWTFAFKEVEFVL